MAVLSERKDSGATCLAARVLVYCSSLYGLDLVPRAVLAVILAVAETPRTGAADWRRDRRALSSVLARVLDAGNDAGGQGFSVQGEELVERQGIRHVELA
jgi:hypothetical protein